MGKSSFNLPVKDEEEAYEKLMSVNRNNDYTTCNLLDFTYFKKKKKNYKLIAIDLSKQTKLKGPKQISFTGRLLAARGQQCFLSLKNQKKLLLNFCKILQTYKNGNSKYFKFVK